VGEVNAKQKDEKDRGFHFTPNTFFIFEKKERTCAKKEKTGKRKE